MASKQHTLWYQSSYDRICNMVSIMIRLVYGRVYLSTVQREIYRKTFNGKTVKNIFLQKSLLCNLVEIKTRILEGKENTLLQKTKQECKRFIEWTLEGWQKSGQRWLYSSLEYGSSLFGLSWLRQAASFSNGEKDREIFIANGSSASYKWEQSGQSFKESVPHGKYIYTYKASLL